MAYRDLILDGEYNVSYWQMDETSGTTIDCEVGGSGIDLDFTLTNGDVNQPGPGTEKSIYFDRSNGSHEYMITSGSASGLTNMTNGTVELWWKGPSGVGAGEQVIIGDRDAWSIMSDSNDKLKLYFSPSGGSDSQVFVDVVVADNAWHHIVVHFTLGTTSGNFVYVDGVLEETAFDTGSTGTVSNSYKIGVAALDGYVGNKGGGYMSNLAIYPAQTLDPSDITAHYVAMSGVTVTTTTPSVTFAALDASITAGGNVGIAPDVVSITFTGQSASVDIGTVIAAPSADVTFTATSIQARHLDVLRDKPIFFWPMDDGSVLRDISGNGYDGVYTGTAEATLVTGFQGDAGYPGMRPTNTALQSFYETTLFDISENWSVEGWMKPLQYPVTAKVWGVSGWGGSGSGNENLQIDFYFGGGTWHWRVSIKKLGGAFSVLDWNTTLTEFNFPTTWQHFAVTASLSGTRSMKLYVNGVLKASVDPGVATRPTDNFYRVFWGAEEATASNDMAYDELALFDYALSAGQISGHALGVIDVANTVSNVPTIDFVGLDAVQGAGQNVNDTAGTAFMYWTGFDPILAINGALTVPADSGNLVYTGLAPSLYVEADLEQSVTNLPEVVLIAPSPQVITRPDDLTFAVIDPDSVEATAYDATALSSLDFGVQFKGQTKIRAMRLGNTSAIPTSFLITAESLNVSLAQAVYFSLDKQSWTNSLLLDNIKVNEITDVIYIRLIVPEPALVGNGSFVISVVQDA